MPATITLPFLPAGHVLTAAKAGEEFLLGVLEFTSTEDGQHFISRLEGFPSDILAALGDKITPARVESLVAIINLDKTAQVYVNELSFVAAIRPSRSVKAGDPVFKSDVVDLADLDLGVSVPNDAGVLVLFSVGWRKGLFYDFGPIAPPEHRKRREYSLSSMLARCYSQVLFQERFAITDKEWSALFQHQWFPFSGLPDHISQALVRWIRAGWKPDENISEIHAAVLLRASEFLDVWRNHPAFKSRADLLSRAIERFEAGDFVSCTSILYPQIEGVLRTHHVSLDASHPSQKNLVTSAVSSCADRDWSLLLPDRFKRYLEEVYFANFDARATENSVSRNTVAHGVAKPELYNQKSAIIAILVLHQLYYFLARPKKPE